MGPLLSANVLLIVSPMAANNASDKISCDGPPFFSLAATDFTGTLLVVSIPLCKECVQVNTPEPFRGRQTNSSWGQGVQCAPWPVSVCAHVCFHEDGSNTEQQARLCACYACCTNNSLLNKLT